MLLRYYFSLGYSLCFSFLFSFYLFAFRFFYAGVADGNMTKYRAVKQTVVHMLPLSRGKLPIELSALICIIQYLQHRYSQSSTVQYCNDGIWTQELGAYILF